MKRDAQPTVAIIDRYCEAYNDEPYVVQQTDTCFANTKVSDRLLVLGGNFFETIPTGGDAYLLKHIIHDWTETNYSYRSRC